MLCALTGRMDATASLAVPGRAAAAMDVGLAGTLLPIGLAFGLCGVLLIGGG